MRNLKRSTIVLAVAAALSVGVVSPADAVPFPPALSSLPSLPTVSPGSSDAVHIENETIRHLNDYRASRGLNRLAADPGLTVQSRLWSQRMAGGSSFSHSNGNVFENIAWSTHAGPDTFFRQWRNSPGHDRNMLTADVSGVGVGVAFAPDGRAFATMQLS